MFWIDCSGASEEKWLGEARVDVDNPYIWEAALEHYLVVSYKVKHTPTLWPGNFILRCLSKLNENICSQKYLHKNFYSSCIGKSKNDLPQTLQISMIRRIYKQIVVYLYTDVLLGNMKEGTPDPHNTNDT